MEKAEQKFNINHDYINNIPYDLGDSNINVTFLAWADDLNIDTPTGSKANNKNSVNKIDHEYEEELNRHGNVFSIQNTIQCNYCGGRHHKDIQCNMIINHLANISYLKKHPKTEETILKSNPTPQRQHPFKPSHPSININRANTMVLTKLKMTMKMTMKMTIRTKKATLNKNSSMIKTKQKIYITSMPLNMKKTVITKNMRTVQTKSTPTYNKQGE
eukprot:751492-Ditylum_brightwellii.AAC.1